MKQIDCYLDFISPYAYLAFEKLPEALLGLSYRVTYRPVLLAALLNARGQRGPAEIEPKRDWTYRQVQWLARAHDVPLRLPASHPFNPLGVLRLALACDARGGLPNRHVCRTIFRHVWNSGLEAADAERLAALRRELAPARDPDSAAVKAELREQTDAALALGLFGVPAFVVADKLFWGFDALPMLRACLEGDPWFDAPDWRDAGRRPASAARRA